MVELSVAVLRVLLLRFGSSWSVEVEGGRRAKSVGSTADVLFSRTSCSLLFVYPSICFGCDGWRGDPVHGMEAMDAASRLGLEVEDDASCFRKKKKNNHRNKLTAEPTILCFGKPKIRNSWRWQDFSLGISFAKLLKPNFCQANFSKHLEMLYNFMNRIYESIGRDEDLAA